MISRLPNPGQIVLNFAAMVFLGTNLYLMWQTQSMHHLTSLKGLGYLCLGIIVCGLVVGMPLQKLHQNIAIKKIAANDGVMTETIARYVRFTGTITMMLQILVVYYVSDYVFGLVF